MSTHIHPRGNSQLSQALKTYSPPLLRILIPPFNSTHLHKYLLTNGELSIPGVPFNSTFISSIHYSPPHPARDNFFRKTGSYFTAPHWDNWKQKLHLASMWRPGDIKSLRYAQKARYPAPMELWVDVLDNPYEMPYWKAKDARQPVLTDLQRENVAAMRKIETDYLASIAKPGKKAKKPKSWVRVSYDSSLRKDVCSAREVLHAYLHRGDGLLPEFMLMNCPGSIRMLIDHGCTMINAESGTFCLGTPGRMDEEMLRYEYPHLVTKIPWDGLGDPMINRTHLGVDSSAATMNQTTVEELKGLEGDDDTFSSQPEIGEALLDMALNNHFGRRGPKQLGRRSIPGDDEFSLRHSKVQLSSGFQYGGKATHPLRLINEGSPNAFSTTTSSSSHLTAGIVGTVGTIIGIVFIAMLFLFWRRRQMSRRRVVFSGGDPAFYEDAVEMELRVV